jgi:hypothetical protein
VGGCGVVLETGLLQIQTIVRLVQQCTWPVHLLELVLEMPESIYGYFLALLLWSVM